jgi:hypothetical protein
MFGLTKREQYWAAQQKAAELALDFVAKQLAAQVAIAKAEEATALHTLELQRLKMQEGKENK